MTGGKISKTAWAKTICEHVNRGKPDCYNYVMKRAVTIDEARVHQLPWFYDQKTACSLGHIAPRYVTNPSMCVDCNRLAAGKNPIYPSTDGGDLTGGTPAYVAPAADANFRWTPAKRAQFFTAYVNTCSVPAALELIGAQMSHLLAIRREDSTFREEMERLEQSDIRQAQFYRAEAAALDNDRMQQLQAQRKFPDSFGSGAQQGLGRADVGSPEQISAEFAQILRGIGITRRVEGSTPAPTAAEVRSEPGSGSLADGTGLDGESVEESELLLQDDPNRDLV